MKPLDEKLTEFEFWGSLLCWLAIFGAFLWWFIDAWLNALMKE